MARTQADLFTARIPPLLPADARKSLAACFDRDELERIERFRFDADRTIYAVSHALLRRALSEHLGASPDAISFHRGPHGKPELDYPRASPPLRFNLTHTRGLAACVILEENDIGVDAERVDRDVGLDLARRFFSPAEVEWLGSLPETRVREAFLDLWTLKESVLKAIGTGLATPLKSFTIEIDELAARIRFAPELEEHASADWRLFRLAPSSTHRLAIAVRSRALEIEVREHRGERLLPELDAG